MVHQNLQKPCHVKRLQKRFSVYCLRFTALLVLVRSGASVAIDALGAVVEKLPGRLGEAEATMRDALHQIRLAYVSVEKALRDDNASAPDPEDDGTEEAE